MWIPGLFLGPTAIVVGVLLLVFRSGASNLFQSTARVNKDPHPERFSTSALIAPAIGAISIGIAVLLIAIFLKPV